MILNVARRHRRRRGHARASSCASCARSATAAGSPARSGCIATTTGGSTVRWCFARRRYQSLARSGRGEVFSIFPRRRDDDDLLRVRRRLDAIASERIAVVGYGNQGRSWALNLRDSGCKPVVCVRRDDTREQAERRRLRGARRRGRERGRHHLHPRARRRDRAPPAAAEARLVRDRRERLHARVRSPRAARRRRHGRAPHARARSAPLLRGGRRVHHRGRRAPRRHRTRVERACSRSRRRSAGCARARSR